MDKRFRYLLYYSLGVLILMTIFNFLFLAGRLGRYRVSHETGQEHDNYLRNVKRIC